MAKKIVVQQGEWERDENRFKYAQELERGNILFFQRTPFPFPQEEIDFLLQQKQGASKGRKNIAYKPQRDEVTNHETADPAAKEKMKQVLRGYSGRVTDFLKKVLAPYAADWKHDYASFRPFQEKGRQLRLRARNDLLHVDSFPTRPLHGARILRFFTNINPNEARRWVTAEPFEVLAEKFGGKGVPFPKGMSFSLASRWMRKMKAGLRWKARSPYDRFMLQMHNFLKENGSFQENCQKDSWEFPPHSCWAVFTDTVSHAALAGQFALEQTFLIPPKALVLPDLAPCHILERLSQRNMVNHEALAQMFAR